MLRPGAGEPQRGVITDILVIIISSIISIIIVIIISIIIGMITIIRVMKYH